MVLEKIDNNNNEQIEAEELHNAITNEFFDKKENIQAIKQKLNSNRSTIAQSLQTILEKKYDEIKRKPFRDQSEEKIVWLYNVLIKNQRQQYTNPLFHDNNFINPINTKVEENNKPNLNNLDHNHNIAFKQIVDRAANKYNNEYSTLIQNIQEKYAQRKPTEIQNYIKYEGIIWAAWKYYEELQQENNVLLKKHGFYTNGEYKDETWRVNMAENFWWRELFACKELFQFLESIQYLWYEQDERVIQDYNKKTEHILKNRWYFGNNKFAEHSKTYQRFQKEMNEKLSETKYNTSIQYLAEYAEPKDESESSVNEYMDHVENTMLYSQAYEDTSKKYGPKLLEGYVNTVQDMSTLQNQYPWFTQAMTRMADYNQKIEKKKEELHINNDTIHRYIEYNKEASQSIYTLQQRSWSLIQKVQEEIQWNTNNSFIFPAIKKHLQEQKEKQTRTDAVRAVIKARNPALYGQLNFSTWAWNGFVDATIGVGTGLWVLISSIYRNGYQTEANADRATKWTNFFKIGQSAAQLEPPVKDGKRNLNFDNGAAQLGSQVSNMLVLLSGAGAIGRWITTWWTKIWLKMTESAGRRAWLFTRASMQWLPSTFQEYLHVWIDKKTARKYALWTTILGSSLEMIAPNNMFFWNPSIKNVLKQLGTKQWSKIIAKEFTKNIGKEVGEEIGQESLQLSVERIINKNINEAQDTDLETSLTWEDFWTTALLTAMTTGMVSSKWSLQVAKNTISHPKTIAWITQDPKRYEDYTHTLQNIIEGKTDLWIEVRQAQTLLDEIHNTVVWDNTYWKENSENDISQKNTEIESLKNNKIIDMIDSDIKLKEIIEKNNISVEWLEIFMNTEYWKKYIDNIIERWEYNLIVDYKNILAILENNPNNLIEKINKLWNIEIKRNNIVFLIEAQIENIELLLENNLLSINEINNNTEIVLDFWDICSLVETIELQESIRKLWIKNSSDLIEYGHIIIDPFTSLENKTKLIHSERKFDLKDRIIYQNIILSKFYELTAEEIQKYGNNKLELNRYLKEVAQLTNLWYKKNLRACSLLVNDLSLSSGLVNYYTEKPYSTRALTIYEDSILWSRLWSEDIAQYWLRNGKNLSIGRQLVSNISNDIIDKLPTQKWLIYRWVWKDLSILEKTLWKIEVGSIIVDPAIPNFTSDKESGEWWARWKTLFIINSKTWKLFTPILEEHVLYKKNTPMKVKNIEHNKNWIKNIIYLEEVNTVKNWASESTIPKNSVTKTKKNIDKLPPTPKKEKWNLQLPIKKWKVEYTRQDETWNIIELDPSQVTIEQAENCFMHWLDVTTQLMQNQNRWLLSSGALFFNNQNYNKLGWDIDVATDVESFLNIAINTDQTGLTMLEKNVQNGKIQDIKYTMITKKTVLDIKNMQQNEVMKLIEKGDIRVEFNIKSPDWLLINSEFFPEPRGYGLIQLWTKRTEWKINMYEYKWMQLNVVNDELAAKSYIINLAHEIKDNTIQGIIDEEKIKDSTRINNIFSYMTALKIQTPQDMIAFIQETYDDYQDQVGKNQGMSEYLKEWLDGLNDIEEVVRNIENDYIVTQMNSENRWSQTTILFEDFINETYEIKKECTKLITTNSNISDNLSDKIIDLKSKINIHDNGSFAYHYEMYQLEKNFINKIWKPPVNVPL